MSTFATYEGDNLAIMRGLPSESIDLIYIDPPYFSQRNYGDFDDRWKSMQHYLDFMVERLKEMHRLLKPTGSIYVHLDWHACHYIKIEMDKIFGYQNFRNEIVWCYSGGGVSKKDFPRKHDNIYRYTKSDVYTFSIERKEYKDNTKSVGKHSTLSKNPDIDLQKGTPITDWWNDINTITGWARGEAHYQTQKPSKLMERIILASSNEGDLVADFFCGSGSFIKKAHELGRSCIGVDVSPKALVIARSPTKREPDRSNVTPKKRSGK